MSNPLRVALVLPGFSAHAEDWAIPALQNLATELAPHHEIRVFSQRYPAKSMYQFNGLTHHAIGGGQRFGLASLRIWLQTAQAIIRHHRTAPFDIIHAFWADEAGFSAAMAGIRINRPVIMSIGGGELVRLPNSGYGAQRFLARRLTTRFALKQASLVTSGSKDQLEMCNTFQVPTQKSRLTPLGVDTEFFQPEQSVSRPVIAQAASLLPVKNQTLLLEVLKLVKQRIPDVKLILAGDGPEEERLTQLAHQLDLSQTVQWCGKLPYLEMPTFFQQAQLYLQTSLHESQGMAVLEAMACGLPVLGTPVGVAEEVACLPPTWDKTVLADQVVKILRDPQLSETFGAKSRQTAESRYSLPVTTTNFLKLYREIV